jgi:hypothetical protein
MNKLPKIFLPIIALFVITDTYAGVADGLYKRMNPQVQPVQKKPHSQKTTVKTEPTHHHQYHNPQPPTKQQPPLPPPSPNLVYITDSLKNSWLKEEQIDQTKPTHINQTNVDSLLKNFMDGSIELGQPSVGYKDYRPKFWEFNAAKDWGSLAKAIIEGGSNQDIDWFYLGLSAEGLKLYKAANSYYAKAISATTKCETTPTSSSNDGCDGFIFPQAINSRIKNK